MSFRLIIIFLITTITGVTEYTHASGQEIFGVKHVEVSMRMIGHKILLAAGDSTSRVLPITKAQNQYKIEFDSDWAFHPEDIVAITTEVLEEAEITSAYLLEVIQCDSTQVVYSYEIADLEQQDIIPCQERGVPRDCYYILISLPEGLVVEKTELSSTKEHPARNNVILLVVLLVIGFISTMLIVKKKRKVEKDPNLLKMGKYLFDQRNATLLFNEQKIELSGKESELLILLYESVNEIIEKEVILQKVWGDEGDYIGRTLDVFISKLRKKLEADQNVKIVNNRGVGYKLVIND